VDDLKQFISKITRKLLKLLHKNKDKITLSSEQIRFYCMLAILIFVAGYLVSEYLLPKFVLWQQLREDYASIVSEGEKLEKERENVVALQKSTDNSFKELNSVMQEVYRIEPSDFLVYLSLKPVNISLFELQKTIDEDPFLIKPIKIIMWGDYQDVEKTLQELENIASIKISKFWLTPGADFNSPLGSGRGSSIGWMPGKRSKSVGFIEELQNEKSNTVMVGFELLLVELNESGLLRLAETPAFIQGRVNPVKSPIRIFQLSETSLETEKPDVSINTEDYTNQQETSNSIQPEEGGYKPTITPIW